MRGAKGPSIAAWGVSCAAAAATAVVVMAAAGEAKGVVVVGGGTPLEPPNAAVGRWNAASGVAIGEHWIISARHVGGGAGTAFTLGGESYIADRVVRHPTLDLMLARVTEPLPSWHTLASNVAAGDPVVIGGVGHRAGEELPGGYRWGETGLAFGRNRLDAVGQRLMFTFNAPGTPVHTPGEATFAMLDSGGGVFTVGREGELRLAGIAVSVSGPFGSSLYGSRAFAINLEPVHAWILSHVAPGEPIASSVAATRGAGGVIAPPTPAPAPGAAAVLVGAGLMLVGRRRRR